MSVVRLVGPLLGFLLATNLIQIHAFWLTDGSLFQQPAELIGSQSVETTPPLNLAQILSSTTASSIKLAVANNWNNQEQTSSTSEPSPQMTNENTKTKLNGSIKDVQSNSQETSNGFVNIDNSNYTASCQCDPGWLRNQTSSWLNKWLDSPQFASHIMKSLGLLSVMPKGNNNNNSMPNVGNNSPRWGTSVAWNKPGARRNERNSQQQQHQRQLNRSAASGHHHRAVDSRPSSPPPPGSLTRQKHNGQRAEQQQALALHQVKVIQGERGPKGDQGERGPSGLISVKDRDALFDLAPASSLVGPRLAFVESEQLLVLECQGPSWRPIPLLAPLHDFRKTIAKFNLNSADERRRLLASASSLVIGRDGQPQVVPLASANHLKGNKQAIPGGGGGGGGGTVLSSMAEGTEQLFERALVKSNSILGALDSASAPLRKSVDDEEGQDDDEKEDEEDEDDDEDDLNMEDEDEFDERNNDGADDDDDDDDDDDNRIGAHGREPRRPAAAAATGTGKSARGLVDSLTSNQITETSERMVVPVSAGANSISAPELLNSELDDQQDERSLMSGEPMRLRLVALNEPFSGNQHGLRGANFECKRNAARAGVKGAFRALLATNFQNLIEIVRYNSHVHKYPIVNMRGETLANSWHELFKAPARTINPLSRIQSFDGRHIASHPNWPNKLVWLGTGSKFGHRELSSQNCDAWHSDSLNKLGYATPLHPPPKSHGHRQHIAKGQRGQHRRYSGDEPTSSSSLIASRNSTTSFVFDVIEKYPCRMPLIVLCIETVAQAE